MPVYFKKSKSEILSKAIEKVVNNTPITATGPGSIARSIIEAVTQEIGDLYDILDFNISQTFLSTGTGSALNGIGALYGVQRKAVSDLAVVDKALGSFYFYIESPQSFDIVIPSGTNVYTSATSFVGRQHSFSTTEETIIPSGRTKSYAGLRPNFVDTVYTAGRNTLTTHDAVSVSSVTIYSTNPKPISPLPGYETDEDYRLRIIKQIRVVATGTVESVRFAGLSVPGVRDIKIRQAAYGMGCFEAVIVPETAVSTAQTVQAAKTAMENVKPLGVRMFTSTPTLVPVDVVIDVFIPGAKSTEISRIVTSRIKGGIQRYLQSFLPGDSLIFNRLLQVALEANENVRDVNISSLVINGNPQLSKNYQSEDNQQLTSGSIVVNIASS